MSDDAQKAMFDMVNEVRRITKVFEEAHAEIPKKDNQASIMTALLGVFIEYSMSCGLPMHKIRESADYALKKYEEIV